MNAAVVSREKYFKNYASASSWALLGTVLVFGLIVVINNLANDNEKVEEKRSVEFMVEKLQKPQTQKKIEKPKPKPVPKNKPASAPLPGLDSNIAGIDLGLPQFQFDGVAEMDNAVLGDMSKVVMTEDSVDEPPEPAKQTAMVYPSKARAKGVTGYVLLNVLINSEGKVAKVKVLESSPAGVFDEVAINGVKQWQFKAAVYQGQPVQVWAKQKISFELN